MLDDLKFIHEHDAQDALGIAEKQWQQLTYDFNIQLSTDRDIRNIVFAGMGGSAFPAVFVRSWPTTIVPFEVVRDYEVPSYVDEHTLFISSSYSGNTEETLAALADAEQHNAEIVVIAAGGDLAEIAQEKQYPLFLIPSGIQPRMSSFYILAAILQILEPLKLVETGSIAALKSAGEWLKDQTTSWKPDTPTSKNAAKKLALEIIGKSVVIYSGPKLFPSANKFKICMNENAKNIAWVNQYPEFNHNEFIGWSSHPVDKPYAVIEIRSNLEHERIQKRFTVTERLLSGKRPSPHVIVPEGNSVIEQLVWTANFGDFTSLYVALLNGLNPTPVDLVERFKIALSE